MTYVLFVISALAGAAGFALLRWSRPRTSQPTPTTERPPVPARPVRPEEPPPLPKPLRITLVVDQTSEEPRAHTITLPSAVGDNGRPTAPTTYLIEGVEVDLHDFFDSFATRSRQAARDLRYCDVVVRGGHVITRAAMPLGVLTSNNPDLVETCARAFVDPTHRRAFQDQVADTVWNGAVLTWLERHEEALAQPLPEVRVDTANLEVPKPPWKPADQRGWPFVFEPEQVDDEASRPS